MKADTTQHGRRREQPGRKGFTMVELLVVIGILIVLAALLVSVIGKATAAARSAQCASNLKQVGAAINMYAIDNNNKLPPLQPPIDSETGKRGDIWPGLVAREGIMWDYTGDLPCGKGVWTCPSCDFMSDAYGGYDLESDSVRCGERCAEVGVTALVRARLTSLLSRLLTFVTSSSARLISGVNTV